MNRKNSLILLNYNGPELIDQRLREIQRHMGHLGNMDVVIYDNGSKDQSVRLILGRFRDQFHQGKTRRFDLRFFRSNENLGFAGGFNDAVYKTGAGRNLFLISNDVAILGDIVTPIEKALEANPESVIGHHIINWNAGWNDFNGTVIHYLAGYFLAMRSEVFEELGGFDERFNPHDYEDVDLSNSIVNHPQFTIKALTHLPISHMGPMTVNYGPERYKITCINRQKFADKWNLINKPEMP